MDRLGWRLRSFLVPAVIICLVACSDDDSGGKQGATPTPTATSAAPSATHTPTPTATPTATQTRTPTTPSGQASVSGLLVVRRDVNAGTADALSPLADSEKEMVGPAFDRALSHADWQLAGEEIRGETDPDGRFQIAELAPGTYTMLVTKTVDGNLMSLGFPIVVGEDGATVLAEVAWGLVRSTSTYDDGGVEVVETFAPNGGHAVWRDGSLVELSDGYRTLTDPDGDGLFENDLCQKFTPVYACPAEGACFDGSACGCVAACPGCENCGEERICAPPIPCTDNRICAPNPYLCNEDGGCDLPGDRCVSVPSCPDCDDVRYSVCVPQIDECPPVDIESIELTVPQELIVGQQGSASAQARLSDESTIDVTWLVDWTSSDESVATIDAWGTITAAAVGSTEINAALGDVTGTPRSLRVVERPTLQRIYVQNINCYYPLGLPPGQAEPGRPTDQFLPPPNCGQVVRVGATLNFRAFGEFANGYYEDITDEVEWRIAPDGLATLDGGTFTAVAAGTVQVSAALGAVTSDVLEIRIVSEATIDSLSIYPKNYGYPVADGGPVRPGDALPCFDCGYSFTVLTGDEVPFGATAHYDTGEWEDVTERVTWRSSDTAVAGIDASGLMTAAGAGSANIDAQLGEVTSAPVGVRVVDEATLLNLYVYQEGTERVVKRGSQLFFHASGYYDVGFERDVTDRATWRTSDASVARFDSPGVLTGVGAGSVEVWAELDGQESSHLVIEGYDTSELDYCDGASINRGDWSDDFNRVVLESDCAAYTAPDVVAIRYTVTETQPHGGIFDPCLDLYILRGEERIRTLREEGCGDPFLAAGAPERDNDTVLKYQLLAFWDLKDEQGETVPPGTYTIFGRFYLYYDPIVSIEVEVGEP
jgi:hypothetical protein